MEPEHTEHAKDKVESENPFSDAELVIYTATAEYASEEPTHEILQDLGLVSFSLWARFEDGTVEIPIVGEASWHIWYSLSQEVYQPDPADPVSDAFVESICEMVDEDVGDGWGAVTEETWAEMRDVEQYIVSLTRNAFLKMDCPEPALIIDWCKEQ